MIIFSFEVQSHRFGCLSWTSTGTTPDIVASMITVQCPQEPVIHPVFVIGVHMLNDPERRGVPNVLFLC